MQQRNAMLDGDAGHQTIVRGLGVMPAADSARKARPLPRRFRWHAWAAGRAGCGKWRAACRADRRTRALQDFLINHRRECGFIGLDQLAQGVRLRRFLPRSRSIQTELSTRTTVHAGAHGANVVVGGDQILPDQVQHVPAPSAVYQFAQGHVHRFALARALVSFIASSMRRSSSTMLVRIYTSIGVC